MWWSAGGRTTVTNCLIRSSGKTKPSDSGRGRGVTNLGMTNYQLIIYLVPGGQKFNAPSVYIDTPAVPAIHKDMRTTRYNHTRYDVKYHK